MVVTAYACQWSRHSSPHQLGRTVQLQRDHRGRGQPSSRAPAHHAHDFDGLPRLLRRPDKVGTQGLPIFKAICFSPRSCCSTSRLVRSLSSLVGALHYSLHTVPAAAAADRLLKRLC